MALFGRPILDLRLLGVWRRTPLAALADAAAPSPRPDFAGGHERHRPAGHQGDGASATVFYIKFPAIAAALINVLALNLLPRVAGAPRASSRRERRQLAWMGATSLGCWLTAIGAGRMIAYW